LFFNSPFLILIINWKEEKIQQSIGRGQLI